MIRATLASLSDGKKLLFLIFFALISALLFSLIGYLIVIVAYGAEGWNWISTMTINADSIGALKIIQIMQSLGMFVFPGFFLAYWYSNDPFKYLGFNSKKTASFLIVIATMIISMPGINFLASLNDLIPLANWMVEMETSAELLTKTFLTTDNFPVFLLNLFMVAVIPAIGEEIIFRGIIQKHLSNITKSQIWGIIITALIFSAFHFQFKGFIPRFALGVMFGFMYTWSGSIWLPIVAHFTNNSIATIGFALMGTGTVDSKVEDFGGLSYLWPIGIVSIIAVAILLMKLREENTEGRIQELEFRS